MNIVSKDTVGCVLLEDQPFTCLVPSLNIDTPAGNKDYLRMSSPRGGYMEISRILAPQDYLHFAHFFNRSPSVSFSVSPSLVPLSCMGN
jgi:hypothetical protein